MILTDHVLVVDGKEVALLGKLGPQGQHWRLAGLLVQVEERVPVGEQSVARVYGVAHEHKRLLVEQPRLASLRVDVSVRAKERLIGGRLVPAHHELCIGIL